jgi:hypothetical protein
MESVSRSKSSLCAREKFGYELKGDLNMSVPTRTHSEVNKIRDKAEIEEIARPTAAEIFMMCNKNENMKML